jgi:leucyl aminopeptidase
MDFPHLHEPALTATVDLLVLVVFGDPTKDALFKAVDGKTGGGLREAAKHESFEGKANQSFGFWTAGALTARRVLVLGAGAKADLNVANLRDLGAAAAQAANRNSSESLAFMVPALGARQATAIQHIVEGALLGTYKFARYLTSEDSKKAATLKSFGILTDSKGARITAAAAKVVTAAVERAQVVASAINRARDLINEPAGFMTPVQLAAEAEGIVKKHPTLSITVLGPKKCEDLGMGMFLAVGKGSEQEARLIHITYKPAKKPKKKIVLIGKGITFDSGGYSLKPSNAMEDMKVDMSGAAAVISAMDAIAQLGSEHEIHAIAACCENLVSGRAYKLGDVLRSMDGTTVEINNTDADGRLTLGDAITYARTKVAPTRCSTSRR